MKRFSWPFWIGLCGVLMLFGLSAFALAWVLLPAVTGLIFSQPITIVSVPFIDYTSNTGDSGSPLLGIVVLIGLFGAVTLFFIKRRR